MISISDSANIKFKETLELFDQHRIKSGKWNTVIGNAYDKLSSARKYRLGGRYDKALEKLESAKKDLERGIDMDPEEPLVGVQPVDEPGDNTPQDYSGSTISDHPSQVFENFYIFEICRLFNS